MGMGNIFGGHGKKAPISIVTDGDGAMRNVVNVVIPYVHYRLCTWHLKRNVVTNTNKGFIHDFMWRWA